IAALSVVMVGHLFGDAITAKLGFGSLFGTVWKLLQWPIVLVFVLLAFAMVYYFAPAVKEQQWKWITPGAIVGIILWLLVSLGFKTYLHYFNSYSATYGSLGAVIL